MTESAIVPIVTLGMLGALAGALGVLFGHSLWVRLADRWSAPRLARARTALYSGGFEAGDVQRATAALRALPARLQTRLLVELSRNLEGCGGDFVSRVARESGIVRRAERLAHSRWWWRRLNGARLLTEFGAEEILVLSLLRDPHPAVRAQAAELAATNASPSVVEALLTGLEDASSACRHAVQHALLRLGPVATSELASYLERGTGLALAAALDVALAVPDAAFIRAAVRLSEDADPQVRTRALRLLGAAGGSDGLNAATRRLEDAAAPVRAAAASTLARLGHWPAAPAIATLLRDRAFDVRRAAGLALRDLGSPGTLMLRRARGDENLFAADMARQVMELPTPRSMRQ